MQHFNRRRFLQLTAAAGLSALYARPTQASRDARRPNFIFILTDDQRHDALSCAGNPNANTTNLDSLAARGARFANAFVTLSICSPSRAACMTGRYGSANGVTWVGAATKLRKGERTFAHILKDAGYATGLIGKWHLDNSPESCGFDYFSYFISNGPQWNRKVNEQGVSRTTKGFIEDYNAARSIDFIERSAASGRPFVLFLCNQLVHMDHNFDWKPKPETMARYKPADMPVPETWNDDLQGRPPYLKTSRSRTQALSYGYDKPENIQLHLARYYASLEDTDAAIGRVISAVASKGLEDNTVYVFMGDNGWQVGEHGFTSKVLPYEQSMRVPMIVAGPGVKHTIDTHLVLNIDLMPTMLELAGLPIPKNVQGRSLLALTEGRTENWRTSFLYECPRSSLGVKPHLAIRTDRYKYVRTFADEKLNKVIFEELYDLRSDPNEVNNLADDPRCKQIVTDLKAALAAHRKQIAATS